MADAVFRAGILDAVDCHLKAQLGHRSEQSRHQYAHLGSGAQRRLVEALKPARAPHEPAPKIGHGNLASTAARAHLDDGSTLH